MKKPFFILCFSILLLFLIAKDGLANSQIHIRRGFVGWWGGFREYQFFDVPENIVYFTEFPLERVKEKISPERWEACFIEYWIFPSIVDAELAVVEYLERICLYMHNFIDVPLPKGLIGNNCWHQIQVGAILFIRNNILVFLTPGRTDESTDMSIFETIARQIDSILVQMEVVHNPKWIPAPVIQRVEMISPFPNTWEEEVIFKIDAIDPQGGKVSCRKYGTGDVLISENGVLSFPLSKNIDSTENPNKAKVKIWVWNEDHIVNSIEVEIPFSQSLAESPFAFMLKQNYPNPFNSSTVIQYVSLISSKFHLMIYDVTGREVVTLVDGVFSPGSYWISWDGKDKEGRLVPSGVYFYRLEAGGEVQTKQMLIVR